MDDVRRERVQQGRAVDGLRAARLRAVRCGVAVLAAVVAIVASGSLSDVAQSRPGAPAAARAGVPQGPLRAVFYDVAPVPARGLHGRPLPITPARRAAVIARQLAALRWARADAAIVPWSAPSSAGDRRLSAVLRTIAYAHSQVRVAALVTGATGTEADQIHALASKRASAQLYLRIGSRPAVFVAPAAGVPRDCAAAERWRAAASGFWLAQATFAGYERCSSAADAWFVDAPGAGAASAPGTFAIWPGYWPAGAKAPQLRRSVEAWRRSVEQMNASGAPLQLIDSLDGWGDGTAIAPSPRWRSHTRFGRYLDALHAHSPARAPLAQLPTTEAAVLSGVTAHAVSVVATVSPGSLAASWWVEFGPSTGYGQTTVPVPLPAASPPSPATAALTALVAATTYHARVVVASGAGVDVGPDVVFTTLTEPRAMRVAAAGDIACDPALTMTATTCHQVATSNAILAGSYDAVLTLGDQQYNSGSPSQFAGSYQPSWGRFKTITHPVVGNHEYGSPGA
ncbi:MAG: hypothetical protein QOK36_2397, partial [Gaiellales bacterium]|nr:hypothetical protein [Gaiellales bacterium]